MNIADGLRDSAATVGPMTWVRRRSWLRGTPQGLVVVRVPLFNPAGIPVLQAGIDGGVQSSAFSLAVVNRRGAFTGMAFRPVE